MNLAINNLTYCVSAYIEMNKPRLSVCLPIYGRPERTKRMLWNIMMQDMQGWELWAIGDGCGHFGALIASGYMDEIGNIAKAHGNSLVFGNFDNNHGGYGYMVRNFITNNARADYLIYCDNDDVIAENHFRNYLTRIEHTDYDIVYFDTFVKPQNVKREASLQFGKIGNQEIIIRLDRYRDLVGSEGSDYGHDWEKIDKFVKAGAKVKKADYAPITHFIMSLPSNREQGID